MSSAPPGLAGLRPGRLAALTDGIFAIAMTLLVLNLQVPKLAAGAGSGELPHDLLKLWPKLLSYALSFVVVGVYWVGHHNQFHYVRRVDRPFLWINIAFLMTISFIPFTAALLGEYLRQQIAVAVYGANLVVVGATLYAVWRYATGGGRLVDPGLSPHVARTAGRRVLMGVAIYLLAIALSFVNTWLSVGLYVVVPVLYILPGHIDVHLAGHGPAGGSPDVAGAEADRSDIVSTERR